ncbi:MAG: M23 family metallopeptidase [Alphaproteobacteria bacterium]|nr:M23 family metallopeptidase [Alphaproteobacteria bacterium]
MRCNEMRNGWRRWVAFAAVLLLVAGCSEPWITGQQIPIPSSLSGGKTAKGGTVTVRKGDTVYGIARRHGADIRSLIDANGLKPPYLLRVGQRLNLPGQRTYRVVKGDTVYGISRKFGVDMRDLVQGNGMRSPYRITVGQTLYLPANGRLERAATASKVPRRSLAASKVAPPPPRGERNFLIPVKGKVLSAFGPKADGLHNDGINIAAPSGTPVRAAENGVVVYVGRELRSFGNLLLIKHADGWMSAYGHMDKPLVKRGDIVKRGDPVAKVGKTGNVTTPQLHFELRRGSRAIDPTRYLTSHLPETSTPVLAQRLAETPR